jgi:RNA polymerase sigma factor (sigma-70 family)
MDGWLAQLRAGDEPTWDDVKDRFALSLQEAIVHMLDEMDLPLTLADDVQQDTWRQARRTIKQFAHQSEDALRGWLLSISQRIVRVQKLQLHPRHQTEMRTAPGPAGKEAWVQQLKAGDKDAWDVLVGRFAQELHTAILRMLNKRDLPLALVDEIEQETWRTAVRKFKTFEWQGDDRLRNWLQSIARRHVQTYQRLERQYLPSLEDIEAQNLANDFAVDVFLVANGLIAPSAEDDAMLAEWMDILYGALLALKPRDREIFLATVLDRVHRSELSARYQVEEDTISMILWRSKAKLRSILKDRLFGADDQSSISQ